ncbi:hypothetical protein J1782_24870 [Rahnella sp. BCC 1045]|uniref:hypothetical protein n=1 Tax=Rahnella sp. BCC 1045 TaxID=2816251 RepID=UPI001C27152E|nr:hypothetical protein [Rahnella sp. BCC 1045]MBU9823128.1 hypothetical protein [Rahnella sp. BCC 1045]
MWELRNEQITSLGFVGNRRGVLRIVLGCCKSFCLWGVEMKGLAICKTCGTDHSDNGGKCRGLIISKPSQVWDGEYPIPAGVNVEVHFECDDSRVWTEFRVEYMRGDVVVLHDYRSDNVESYSNARLSFRPIRSPEDVARDEAIEAMRDVGYTLPAAIRFTKEEMAALYNAGYRKME